MVNPFTSVNYAREKARYLNSTASCARSPDIVSHGSLPVQYDAAGGRGQSVCDGCSDRNVCSNVSCISFTPRRRLTDSCTESFGPVRQPMLLLSFAKKIMLNLCVNKVLFMRPRYIAPIANSCAYQSLVCLGRAG
jgi:hypothetical protein